MARPRPIVLSIAGMDPSGGAGLLADTKTLEIHKVLPMGISTGVTFQTENVIEGVDWEKPSNILRQLELLLQTYKISVVKVGLIESLNIMNDILTMVNNSDDKIRIIWDPVLRASAGYDFHQNFNSETLKSVLSKVNIVTPNYEEYMRMEVNGSEVTWIVTSAGRQRDQDWLIRNGRQQIYRTHHLASFEKHGSGCVFSSSLAANLALGYPLHKSILRTKKYMTGFLESTPGLLGYHKR